VKPRLVVWFLLVGTVAALEYSARFSGGQASSRNEVYSFSDFVSGVVFYGLIFAVVLAIAFERSDLFTLRRPIRNPVGLAAAVLIGVYVCEVIVTLLPIRDPGSEQGLTPTHWESSHAGAFAANFVLFAGIAPVVEELTFRGVGQSLLQRFGRWPAIVVVGVAFGVWHGLVEAELVLIPFGIGLAYLRDRTRSVIPGIAVHAIFNGAALVLAVAG